MVETINALTDAGASIATVIVLALLLWQQSKTIAKLGEIINKNTEAIRELKEAINNKI